MASFERDPSGSFIIRFRHAGKVYKRSLRLDGGAKEAARICDTIEATSNDIRRGRAIIPATVDVATYFLSGGRAEVATVAPEKAMGLGLLFTEYQAKLTAGSKERNSLKTEAIHGRHLCRHFGDDAPVGRLAAMAQIQGYVDARASKGAARVTIRKELNTLRFVSAWAANRGVIRTDPCASWKIAMLTFPKEVEKPPFQTWDQIARQVSRGNLSAEQQADLWECLWLDRRQAVEIIDWAEGHEGHPWLLPMLAIATYTGARRSEILRSEVDDWDFESEQVAIRQKKSDRSKTFTRRYVPIHPDLAIIVREWLVTRPGTSPFLIVNGDGDPLSINQAAHGFRAAVTGTKWHVLRGYHVLRHSFASNLASRGIDQRVIDELLGHSTAEMSRRYRHLAPTKKRAAVEIAYDRRSATMVPNRANEP